MLRPLPCPFLGLAAPFQFVSLLFALLPTSVRVAQGLLCVLAFLLLRLRRSRTPLAFGCVCLFCLSPLCVCPGPFFCVFACADRVGVAGSGKPHAKFTFDAALKHFAQFRKAELRAICGQWGFDSENASVPTMRSRLANAVAEGQRAPPSRQQVDSWSAGDRPASLP